MSCLIPVFDHMLTLELPSWAEELVMDMYSCSQFSTDSFLIRCVNPLQSLLVEQQLSTPLSAMTTNVVRAEGGAAFGYFARTLTERSMVKQRVPYCCPVWW